MLAFLVYTRIVARLGTDQLAAHSLALRSLEIAILPGFALGTAATALVGQYLGAGRPDMAEDVAKRVRFFALSARSARWRCCSSSSRRTSCGSSSTIRTSSTPARSCCASSPSRCRRMGDPRIAVGRAARRRRRALRAGDVHVHGVGHPRADGGAHGDRARPRRAVRLARGRHRELGARRAHRPSLPAGAGGRSMTASSASDTAAMRIGIVSDIHCNHEALRIALDRMGDVDELLCAGDAVYQFRFSNEVMQLLREARRALHPRQPRRGAARQVGRARPLGRLGRAAMRWPTWPDSRTALETRVDGKSLRDGARQPLRAAQRVHLPEQRRALAACGDRRRLRRARPHALPDGRARRAERWSSTRARRARRATRATPSGCRTRCSTRQSGEVTFDDFQDPTRAAVDPSIIPGGLEAGRRPGTESTPSNPNFWRPDR